MASTIRAQVISFSAILQSLQCVQDLAWKGTTNTWALESTLESILITGNDVDQLYPDLNSIKAGLLLLNHQMSEAFTKHDVQIAHYLAAILHLSKKLKKYPQHIETIRKGIEEAQKIKADYPVTHANMQARLAGIYTDSISLIQPRIMVKGEPSLLHDRNNISKIRALLLAAIRNALLWQHHGGSKWKLIFARKKYYLQVQSLLKQL